MNNKCTNTIFFFRFYFISVRSLLYSTTVDISVYCYWMPCLAWPCVCAFVLNWMGKIEQIWSRRAKRNYKTKEKKRTGKKRQTSSCDILTCTRRTVYARCPMLDALSCTRQNEAEGSKRNAQLTLWALKWIPNYGGTWLFTIVGIE